MNITQCWIRLLLPFRWSNGDSFAAICDSIATGGHSLWDIKNRRDPGDKLAHSEYFLEYLPHVSDFLFNGIGESGCRYFQVAKNKIPHPLLEGCSVWRRELEPVADPLEGPTDRSRPTPRGIQRIGLNSDEPVWIEKPPQPAEPGSAGSRADRDSPGENAAELKLRIRLQPATGVEAWLSKSGSGVVSVSFMCQPSATSEDRVDCRDLVHFIHALVTAQKAVWFQGSSTANERSSVDKARVGDNSWQHVHGWLRDLLQPFRSRISLEFDLRGVAFTALEIAEPTDADQGFTRELDDLLSHLAQSHPHSHPGDGDAHHVQRLAINRRHRCALSLNGAAHAALMPAAGADPYDKKRLRRIQVEYFPGYLLAQLQRQCLQQFLNESAAATRLDLGSTRRAQYEQLLTKVTRFSLEGEFVQACWRDTLQKHHELSQQVCLIHQGLETVRAAMGDFAALLNQQHEREQHVAARHAEHAHREEAEQSERTMQILEVFIVTFYSLEMAHVLGAAFDFRHSRFLACSLGGVAVATFFLVASFVHSRGRRAAAEHEYHRGRGYWKTILFLFLIVASIQGAFLGMNAYFSPPQTKAVNLHGAEHVNVEGAFPERIGAFPVPEGITIIDR